MKHCRFLLLSFALLSSCRPTILVRKDDLKKIPHGSSKVIAVSKMTPDEAYSYVAKSFAKSGCPVAGIKESMQVICNGKSIEGGTMLRAMAYIEPTDQGSNIIFSGEWGLNATGQAAFGSLTRVGGVSGTDRIVWKGIRSSKPCIAFQHLIVMAIDVPSDRIRYER